MSKTRMMKALVALGATALMGLAGSCKEETPCDPGQDLVNGMCQPGVPDAAPLTPQEDAAPPTEAGPSSPFGRVCATSAECTAPADYCANPPGNCTAKGCVADPTLCPQGWTCLAAFDVCIPPM
jgi:hypothetical protein